ncbi:hypothetical protein [Arabidopsis thaliana]|uniref:Uncharacterized protein F26B15_40 n=1 Tax=Arabidopsis thaliana TaxID=3702 RepID=Q9M230_ARATH|nr:hypothetical protein [Arabidopsis thaliana]
MGDLRRSDCRNHSGRYKWYLSQTHKSVESRRLAPSGYSLGAQRVKHAWTGIVSRLVTFREVIVGTMRVRTKHGKSSFGVDPLAPEITWGPQIVVVRALEVVSEPNLNECGVKKARTIGGYVLTAQRTRWVTSREVIVGPMRVRTKHGE